MSYYKDCRLKIQLPPDRASDKDAIRQALVNELPGVEIEFTSSPNADPPSVAEAFVPDNHALAGMKRQDFGATEMKPVAGETLFGIASKVLDDFEESKRSR